MRTTALVRTGFWLLLLALIRAPDARAGGPYVFVSVTPCRLLDTREPPGVPLTSGPQYNYPVWNLCGIPQTARAAALNLTVVSPTAAGFVAAYPYLGPYPGVSTINVNAGEPALANGAIVPLGLDYTYELSVVYGTSGGGTTHLVIDVTGYFQDP